MKLGLICWHSVLDSVIICSYRWSTYNDSGNPCERMRKVCLRDDESTHRVPSFDWFTEFSTSFSTFTKNARLLLLLSLLYTCPFDVLHVHIVPFTETNPTERIRKKKKKTKRSIRVSPRANYPRDGLDVFSTFHTNFSINLSTMVTIKSLSLPRCHIFSYARMSRLEPSRRPASLL